MQYKPKLNSWDHLTAEALLAMLQEHKTWGKVAAALGIKSYCVPYKVRQRLGV